jgi:heme-degrading monooxygenase HmoA
VIRQLRIYEIFEDTKAAFHERFRDHAVRIMASHGFHIVAAWESTTDGRVEFLYVLEWRDVATMTETWEAFMADEEWAAVKRETGARHGRMVGAIEDRILEPVPYLTDGIGAGRASS